LVSVTRQREQAPTHRLIDQQKNGGEDLISPPSC
jgi:hypothetical protein